MADGWQVHAWPAVIPGFHLLLLPPSLWRVWRVEAAGDGPTHLLILVAGFFIGGSSFLSSSSSACTKDGQEGTGTDRSLVQPLP